MASIDIDRLPAAKAESGPLVYRQRLLTRITHWIWAVCLFFLLLTGLQIFNAHPALYIGQESGFDYDNAVLRMAARNGADGPEGVTTIFGREFVTTGTLGYSDGASRGFPSWATIPSGRNLATGRVIHFFFAWVLVGTLVIWALSSLLNGHLRDLIPTGRDLRALPRDVVDHARLRFHHTARYNVLQKLAYGSVMLVAFPLIIATGLAMSPSFNATAPWLLDVFGGRQTARTIHFVMMLLFVAFFVVHILMILAAGPIRIMRAIITGWYRTDPPGGPHAR